MIFTPRKRRQPGINIVPLLDILTILLIFFVVTTTFKRPQPAVKIDLPAASLTENVPAERAAIITLTADLRLFLDAMPTTIEDLPAALRAKYGERPQKVALRADRTVPLGELIRLTQALKGLGIDTLPTFTGPENPAEKTD
jgi:biopolymer transport protein ExbD